jgi:uncharacterized protein
MRFECQSGCTACCRQRGFVNLSEADLVRAAGFLDLTPATFERKYVYRTSNRMRLRVPRGAHCPFLEESGCRIHPAKPTQCRTFPFWPELVDSAKEWHRTASYCPGIGKGEFVEAESAGAQAGEMRQSFPILYQK